LTQLFDNKGVNVKPKETAGNVKILWRVNCSGSAPIRGSKPQRKAARASVRVKDDLGFYRVYVVIELAGRECQVSGRVTASSEWPRRESNPRPTD
jgi:hypothetical protein